MRLLAALTAAPLDKGTPHFEPSNLEIVSVDVGNPAFNVIPAAKMYGAILEDYFSKELVRNRTKKFGDVTLERPIC